MLSRVFLVFLAVFLACELGANEASVFGKNPLQSQAPQKQTNTQSTQTQPKAPATNGAKNFNNVVLSPNELRNIAGSDEPDVAGAELYEKSEPIKIELSAKALSEQAYIYEPFGIELTLKGDNLAQFRPEIALELSGAKNLNPKVKFVDIAKNEAKATLWFIAYNENAKISDIAVIIKRGGEFLLRQGTSTQIPLIKPLELRADFCNVVASSLNLKSFKASKFDEFSNLITLELEAKNGNLSEFRVPISSQRGGIDGIKGGVESTTATYSLIASSELKSISFSYFSTSKNAFESIEVAIKPASNDLSTQTSLNPVTSEFATYKSIAVYGLIILCLLSFMLWRSYYGLVLAVIFGAYALYDARPFAGASIKAGSAVTILPASGSSVFYKPSNDEKVQVLLSQEKYTKILLDNGKIGWVRNENIK